MNVISEHKKQFFLALAALAVVLIVLLLSWPVHQSRILTYGIDEYKYHRPIFGSHTQGQEVFINQGIEGVGAILVNLRHQPQLADVQVDITDSATKAELLKAVIPQKLIVDDQFAQIKFPQLLTIRNKKVIITLSAPAATALNPIGVRYNPQDVYKNGRRWENGEQKPGDLSLALMERVPVWQYIFTIMQQNPQRSLDIFTSLLAGIAVSLLSLKIGWRKLPSVYQTRIEAGIIIVVALVTLVTHLQAIPLFHGVSGGDPYNYLFITKSLVAGQNPFLDKRLPGYPALLIPAYLTSIDDIWYMRLVGSLAATGIILLLPVLAKRLGLPWSVQLLSALCLALLRDFWWTSFRPEPYTVYAFILLAGLVVFMRLEKARAQVIFGLLLGAAAMTRQEGFLFALVMSLATLFYWRQLWWKGYLRVFIPAALLVLPFFLSNAIYYHNPLFTPYFEGDRLQIVDSWNSFQDNLGAIWGVVGTLWRPTWEQNYRIGLSNPLLISSVILTIGWGLVRQSQGLAKRKLWQVFVATVGVSMLLGMSWLAILNKVEFSEALFICSAGVLLGSMVPFLLVTRWRGFLVVVVLASQFMIAVWFHPFAKHMQQDYALVALLVSVAIIAPKFTKKDQGEIQSESLMDICSAGFFRAGIVVPVIIGAFWLFKALPAEIDHTNESTALDSVSYRAVKSALRYPGPYGVDQAYLPARLYFGDKGLFFTGDESHTEAEEIKWLADNHIKTLVLTNNNPAFKKGLSDWKMVAHHKSAGAHDFISESWVYEAP